VQSESQPKASANGNESMEVYKQVNSAQVIANYETLSALTAQMREAAVRGEWIN